MQGPYGQSVSAGTGTQSNRRPPTSSRSCQIAARDRERRVSTELGSYKAQPLHPRRRINAPHDVGIDLHRKWSQLAALDAAGQARLSRRIPSRPEEFFRVFGELGPEPMEVAFEATFGCSWLADLLADAGIPAHMAHPLATKAIVAGRIKNDAVDARMLAHLLRANLLPEAWIALGRRQGPPPRQHANPNGVG